MKKRYLKEHGGKMMGILKCKTGMILSSLIASSLCLFGQKEEGFQQSGDLLLVIDMQNAYAADGPWACPHMEQAADHIITLIESGQFGQIIFTRFEAPQDPVGTWKEYNTINKEINEDADLNDLIPKLKSYASRYPLCTKCTYSSLSVPEIRTAVENCTERGGSVVLTGVVSECCVLATAFQAIDMGCPVVYLTDACAGSSDETEDAVVKVLKGLDYVQTVILDTAGYLEKKTSR